jgi:hypothetical protein
MRANHLANNQEQKSTILANAIPELIPAKGLYMRSRALPSPVRTTYHTWLAAAAAKKNWFSLCDTTPCRRMIASTHIGYRRGNFCPRPVAMYNSASCSLEQLHMGGSRKHIRFIRVGTPDDPTTHVSHYSPNRPSAETILTG